MWPFKCKNKSSENIGASLEGFKLPGDEMAQIFQRAVQVLGEDEALKLIFEKCDFKLVRDEITDFFNIAAAEAKRNGNENVAYKTEFVQGWYAFSANPNANTAHAWLRAAPDYKNMIHTYLIECCPGGKFAFYNSMKR
jgi:hypothetical protein